MKLTDEYKSPLVKDHSHQVGTQYWYANLMTKIYVLEVPQIHGKIGLFS